MQILLFDFSLRRIPCSHGTKFAIDSKLGKILRYLELISPPRHKLNTYIYLTAVQSTGSFICDVCYYSFERSRMFKSHDISPSILTTQPAIAVFKGILYTYVGVCCVRAMGC